MEPFRSLTAVAVPLVRANVDTDAIIPSREIKTVSKTGLAEGLFAGWRYRGIGTRDVDPNFILNKPQYAGARILLGGENFGCGSSREHAVWALHEYGFRAIVAPSFAPIFFGNCVRNGVLPATLARESVVQLASAVEAVPARNLLTVNLERLEVSAPGLPPYGFAIDPESREMLLQGLDALALAVQCRPVIEAFLARDRSERPWVYLR